MRGYLYIVLVAAAVTYLSTPLARVGARALGAITPLRDRDVHLVPIPRMGGTAMLLGFAAAILAASRMPFLHQVYGDGNPWVILAGASAVCLLGVADDVWSLDAVTKLAGQALVLGLMAWQGVQLVSLPVAGVTIPSSQTLLVLTVLAGLVTINAVNFVDGLDGLAAGVVGIAGTAFFVYSYLLSRDANPSDYSSLASLVTAALIGACLGFLPHNFNPARIFMGDSGSMLIGLLLATSTITITGQVDPAIQGSRIAPAFFPILLPLAILALPFLDLLLAVARRLRSGRMPWHPDRLHLHHRMLDLGHSQASAVLVLYAWTATVAFSVASMAFIPVADAVLGGLGAALVSAVLTAWPRLRPRLRGGTA